MQIGKIIRKHRKLKNMTQEEMANRLGVTAPAVNKWENGNSFPDIMLLSPIARLLGITLDALLSFRDELTDEEVNQLIKEMGDRLTKERYEDTFQWAKEMMELYPNCEKLIWQMAVVLDAKRLTEHIPESEKYGDYLKERYVRLLESKDENVRKDAADSLFEYYSRREDYEKAEEYLSYFSDQNPEKKRKQAVIFSKTNRINEAYKIYEEMLLAGYQMMNLIFHSIYKLAMQEKDMEKAHMLVEKQAALAAVFEMGEYYEVSCGLELATEEKDVEDTLEIMEKMINSIDKLCDFCKSPLYEHMSFKETDREFLAQMRIELHKCFQDENMFGYLKENSRWRELAGRPAI